MTKTLFGASVMALALVVAACGGDDEGSGGAGGTASGTGGSGASGGSATGVGGSGGGAGGSGGGTECPGAMDCQAYCSAAGGHIDALMCSAEGPYDVADCVQTCEATFAMFESLGQCVCEYHASLACPAADASCYECDNAGNWTNTADCCSTEVAALQDCVSNL